MSQNVTEDEAIHSDRAAEVSKGCRFTSRLFWPWFQIPPSRLRRMVSPRPILSHLPREFPLRRGWC